MESFPLRDRRHSTFRLTDVAVLLGLEPPPDPGPELRQVASLAEAGPDALSILAHRRYLPRLESSQAGALLVSPELEGRLSADEGRPRLEVEDVHAALARVLEWLHPPRAAEPEIHPSAVIGRGVALGEGVRVGPYAVIEAGAALGDRARIGAHVVVGAGSEVGSDSILHPQVVLYPGSRVGRGVILHSGVRVGVDGFGYVFVDGEHRKVPQVGGCRLEDGVEIGANTTVDRGSIGDTRVGAGTKIDNLVQLGHNVVIGGKCILVSQTGVAGSTEFGRGVVSGGQAGIAGHLRIGDGAQLAAQAGIMGDVPPGETYMGFPGRPRGEFLRTAAAQRKVPEMLRRLRELEREVALLKEEAGEG
jgi:UDP-3-O-[3-hydroxymyristoyl] glucosamine N-acyltransferase